MFLVARFAVQCLRTASSVFQIASIVARIIHSRLCCNGRKVITMIDIWYSANNWCASLYVLSMGVYSMRIHLSWSDMYFDRWVLSYLLHAYDSGNIILKAAFCSGLNKPNVSNDFITFTVIDC